MTGSQYVIWFLTARGIRTVFAYPGANVLPLYRDLTETPALRHVVVRHEQGAAFAASGYAKLSGTPGVCIATSGPGATNLITGIADACLDSAPLLAITGQVPRGVIGRDAFQEADIMGMTIPVTKHNYLVKDAAELPRVLAEAWTIATTGRMGPVLVDITRDVFTAEVPADTASTGAVYAPKRRSVSRSTRLGMEAQIDAVREALEQSYRPLLLAGGGVVSAHASFELGEFARRSGIPVAVTLMGKGIVLPPDIRSLGMAGTFGAPRANAALRQCDLLIAVGTRFSDRTVEDWTLCSRARTVIHCDIDPAEIDKNVRADIGVVSDAAVFLSALTALSDRRPAGVCDWTRTLEIPDDPPSLPDGPMTDGAVMRCVADAAKAEHPVFIVDVGDNQMAAARWLTPAIERGFVTTGGLGAMGFALPAAVGAVCAVGDTDPGEPLCAVSRVYAVAGDGGLQMTVQELATLRQLSDATAIPVTVIVIDNHSLGMVAHLAHSEEAYRMVNPNFVKLADAYGIPAQVVRELPSLWTALKTCINGVELIIAETAVRGL